MDEFIVKATLDEGEKVNLLAFGLSIQDVVDNLVQMDTVQRVDEAIWWEDYDGVDARRVRILQQIEWLKPEKD